MIEQDFIINELVLFSDVENGHFFMSTLHIWVKTNRTTGKCLSGNYGCCNFMLRNDEKGVAELVIPIDTINLAKFIQQNHFEHSNNVTTKT